MSFAEILSEIPRLSFAERQEWVRCAIAVDDAELNAEENALLDARMEDFRRQPHAGIPLEELRDYLRQQSVGLTNAKRGGKSDYDSDSQ